MSTLRHACTAALVAGLAITNAAPAQMSGDGFLFRAPKWSVSMHGGVAIPRAQSEVFTFTSEQLTVDREDFRSPAFGVDVDMRIFERTRLVFSIDHARTKHRSEFRDYVDNEELPIEQTTRFARLNFSVGVKQYVTGPGRSIGRFAWVPTRVAPFVGAGIGAMRYDFHQYGDFIDFYDMDVFSSQFQSRGWAGTAHGRVGLDYSLTPRTALTLQGRYDWSEGATLSRDFEGFDRIDLNGFSTTLGITVRF